MVAKKKKISSKKVCLKVKNKRYVACIKKHIPLLQYMTKLDDVHLARVSSKLKPTVLKILSDIALNLISPRGMLHSKFSQCPQHKAVALLSQKPSAKTNAQKRKLIAQEGSGFIGPLIGLALPTLLDLVSNIFKK